MRLSICFGKSETLDLLEELWNVAFRGKLLPPEFIFINRIETGIINVLYSLKARVAATHTIKKFIKRM